jgi:hypothetical protein
MAFGVRRSRFEEGRKPSAEGVIRIKPRLQRSGGLGN